MGYWVQDPRRQEESKTSWETQEGFLIEVGLANAADIKIDYRRSILMIKRRRVGEGKGEGDDGRLELDDEALKKVGINVGTAALQKAVYELLSE